MNTLLYLHNTNAQSAFLAERWLRIRGKNSDVILFYHPATHAKAKELKETYSLFEVLPLPKLDDVQEMQIVRNKFNVINLKKIVLPLSLESEQLRFVMGTQIPGFKRHYNLFRHLWLVGLREFELFSLFGSRNIYIPHILDEFINIHKGKRCFIVGNGPSLNKIDMSKLRNEITFGCNRCFLGYNKWGYPFTYWAFGDRLQVEEYYHEYEDNLPKQTVKFFPFEYTPFMRFNNISPIPFHFGVKDYPKFSDSCTDVYMGHSMVYMMLQIAAVMGFKQMILIGVDHNYNLDIDTSQRLKSSGSPEVLKKMHVRYLQEKLHNLPVYKAYKHWRELKGKTVKKQPSAVHYWKASDAKAATHFDTSYTKGDNKRFIPPRPHLAETAYECASKWAKEKGVEILNASPGSGLKSFPLVDFNSFF